jgi:hypothetical protein
LKSYREKEPMTPAKIKEHEPTAVKREMTEKIVERGQTGTNNEEAAEIARKKGMAKGIAGVSETGNEYEHGTNAAGTMSSKSDESTPGVSAQFSCGFCNKTYKSREELKQHTTQEHSN